VLVPVHELLHAAGCLATGGAVGRLELLPLFGGGVLHRVLPWVVPGGRYAGRLAGFSPAGDLSYVVTVLAPHVVLAFAGAAVCRYAAARGRLVAFGAGLAAAAQPLASLTGDFYEAASILVSDAAGALGAGWTRVLRGDDILVVISRAIHLGGWEPPAVVIVNALLGIALAAVLLRLAGGVVPRPGAPTTT